MARAVELISELEALLEQPPEGESKIEIVRFDDGGVVAMKLFFPPAPKKAKAIVKDILNNLRSSLDHATFASAVSLESARLSQVKFPFGDTEAEAAGDLKRRGRDLRPEIGDLCLGFKPFRGGNALLWSLNKARNINEHRALIHIGIDLGDTSFAYSFDQPINTIHAPMWLDDETALLVPMAGDGDRSVEVTIGHNYHLGDVADLATKPAVATLNALAGEVERVIVAIEAETLRLSGAE